MSYLDRIIAAVLEADDDFDDPAKELLGQDIEGIGSQEGSVERHGRWADVEIGDDHWCISYLTPVAVFIHGRGLFITDREWSQATSNHIRKFANELGMGAKNYAEVKQRAKRMTQQDLIEKFKQDSGTVKWTARQSNQFRSFRDTATGLKSDSDERVEIEPFRPN